jgi:hypothetical protein
MITHRRTIAPAPSGAARTTLTEMPFMNKLLPALLAVFVASAAIPVQAGSHAGGAPMKPAAAASAASDKKMDKKEAKKAEKKMEKKVPADKADAKK